MTTLSIVIPMHDEAENVGPLLDGILGPARARTSRWSAWMTMDSLVMRDLPSKTDLRGPLAQALLQIRQGGNPNSTALPR